MPNSVKIVREYEGIGVEPLYDWLEQKISGKGFYITEKYLRPYDVGELTAYEGRIIAHREGAMTRFYGESQRDVIEANIESRTDMTISLSLSIDAKDTNLINWILKDLEVFVGNSKDRHHVSEGVIDDACERLCKK